MKNNYFYSYNLSDGDSLPILVPIGSFIYFSGMKYEVLNYYIPSEEIQEEHDCDIAIACMEVENDIDLHQIIRHARLTHLLTTS
jgi:hypothetical protein